jgi:hypothetical protein
MYPPVLSILLNLICISAILVFILGYVRDLKKELAVLKRMEHEEHLELVEIWEFLRNLRGRSAEKLLSDLAFRLERLFEENIILQNDPDKSLAILSERQEEIKRQKKFFWRIAEQAKRYQAIELKPSYRDYMITEVRAMGNEISTTMEGL